MTSIPGVSDEIAKVFAKIEEKFRQTDLGPDRWYIATLGALAGGNDPELAKELYLYLTSKPDFSTSTQRQALIRRLREVLVKSVCIVGVCKPLEAIMAINTVEKEEDKDRSETRRDWQCDEKNLERGMDWMSKVYTGDMNRTLAFYDDHKDFVWISKNITYGLYLSDRQILDDMDTQMVVLPGIMIQNLPKETSWHIRGTRRIGASMSDVQAVWDSVQLVAEFLGFRLHRVPTVAQIEPEVSGSSS